MKDDLQVVEQEIEKIKAKGLKGSLKAAILAKVQIALKTKDRKQ